MMPPALRRFTYATHLTSCLGWVGAAIVFGAMAHVALTTENEATVRGAYLVMAPTAWLVLVPLAHASLITGIALSIGTAWGLIRHYWVVLKLGITVFSTVILMIYMGTFRQMAGVAADPVVDVDAVRNASPLIHAILALVLLLVATALAVYKPLGMTPYGRRGHSAHGGAVVVTAQNPNRSWLPYVLLALFVLMSLVIVLHLVGAGADHH